MVFASDTPLTVHQMVSVIENFEKTDIEEALGRIQEELTGRAFTLKKVGGGYQFASRPEYSRWIKKMYQGKQRNRLTRAALETLAIIAFKQPISRVEVSAIRGVNSDGVIKGLLERKLITISGRGDGQGRALLFNTTPEFLQYFSINDLADLPKPKEIEELLAAGEAARIMGELEQAAVEQEREQEIDEPGLLEPSESSDAEFLHSETPTEEITLPEPDAAPESEAEAAPLMEATLDEVLAGGPSFTEEETQQADATDESFLAEEQAAQEPDPLAEAAETAQQADAADEPLLAEEQAAQEPDPLTEADETAQQADGADESLLAEEPAAEEPDPFAESDEEPLAAEEAEASQPDQAAGESFLSDAFVKDEEPRPDED